MTKKRILKLAELGAINRLEKELKLFNEMRTEGLNTTLSESNIAMLRSEISKLSDMVRWCEKNNLMWQILIEQ